VHAWSIQYALRAWNCQNSKPSQSRRQCAERFRLVRATEGEACRGEGSPAWKKGKQFFGGTPSCCGASGGDAMTVAMEEEELSGMQSQVGPQKMCGRRDAYAPFLRLSQRRGR